MTEPTSDKQMRKYLAAFADGELEVQESLQVLEHMKMNPDATGRVMHHQQMRRLVDRALREDAPETPDALRQAVQAALATMDQTRREELAGENHPEGSVIARIGRWVPLGMAAAMLIGVMMFSDSGSPSNPDHAANPTPAQPQLTSLVSAGQARMFGKRHTDCSRELDRLKDRAMFPDELETVPEAVEAYFGGRHVTPSLDLSSIGFRFDGLGKCAVPGHPAVHLVYHAIGETQGPDTPEALSLWITPYDGEISIQENVLYIEAGVAETGDLPIIIWRSGDMMHYLVGDELGQAEKAAKQLLASRS